jgi:hypothetical protein
VKPASPASTAVTREHVTTAHPVRHDPCDALAIRAADRLTTTRRGGLRLLASTYVFEMAVLPVWIWVAITAIADRFKSDDLAGAAKAGRILLIPLVPCVVARGDKMKHHQAAA